MGMYHALLIMSMLLRKYHLTQAINLASDNLELVKRTSHFYLYAYHGGKMYCAPHMDIQSEINFLLSENFPRLHITHVRGHQDTKKNAKLTWTEVLNVRADKLATIARTSLRPLPSQYKISFLPRVTYNCI